MNKKDIKKVVLAYSGGLDTSIIIPWLKENYNNCEVVAVSGDVGQGTELDGLEEKAIATGASKLYILDLKEEYVKNYIYKNIYTDRVTCRVGLLNIFDYVSNNSFNDYFHMNTTSCVGSIQYSTNSNGLLEEADVTDLKHVVPVVSINSALIKSGDGTLNNPYVLE